MMNTVLGGAQYLCDFHKRFVIECLFRELPPPARSPVVFALAKVAEKPFDLLGRWYKTERGVHSPLACTLRWQPCLKKHGRPKKRQEEKVVPVPDLKTMWTLETYSY